MNNSSDCSSERSKFCPSKAMVANIVTHVFTLVVAVVLIFKKRDTPFLVLLSVVVGTLAAWLLVQRDTYLPFLGYAAVPPTLLKDRFAPSNANVEAAIDVDAPDGTRVLYWGARPSKDVKSTPWKAYDDWSNAGVAVVKDKRTVVVFHCPGEYEVTYKGKLERHLHYRLTLGSLGMLSPVQTIKVKC